MMKCNERFEKKFNLLLHQAISDENLKKICFVNPCSIDVFQSLVYYSHILLDSYPFGGCNGSFEAFGFGIPVVTMPAEFINGHFTYGLYQKMGILDCIALSFDEYLEITKKLVTDEIFYKSVREKITSGKSKIFEEKESVIEWMEFCEKIIIDEK